MRGGRRVRRPVGVQEPRRRHDEQTVIDGEPEHARVFVSYSHDSPEHADRVLAFSNRLRQLDSTVT